MSPPVLTADDARLAAGVRRLRRWRRVANSLWLCLLLLGTAICLQHFVPGVGAGLALGFGIATGVLALALTAGRCAFAFGLVRCPRCQAPFEAPPHAPIKRRCGACGFDVIRPGNPTQ